MGDEEKQESRGFRVTDRRRFTDEAASSEAEEPTAPTSEPPPAAASAPARAAEAPAHEHGGHEHGHHGDELDEGDYGPVPVNFSSFVLGLSTQALLLLGEIENPVSHRVERDLVAAKQVIDILGMLEQKTINNLDASEQELLSSALFDLRMRYVELARAENKEGS